MSSSIMFVHRVLPASTIFQRRRHGVQLLLRHYRLFSSSQPKHDGIRILYASQTGTAKLFAHQLQDNLEDEGFDDITIQGLDEGPSTEALAPGHLNLLLASCTGRGEPPDNARKFYEWVMKDPSAKLASNTDFAVFGLGDSCAHPANYNTIGKELDDRLQALGGNRVKDLGLGDDGACIEDDFDKWMGEITKCITTSSESQHQSSGFSMERGEEEEEITKLIADFPAVAAKSNNQTRPTSKKYPILLLDPAQNNVIRRDLFHLMGSNRFYPETTAKLKVISNHMLTSDAGESSLHEIRISLEHDYAINDNEADNLAYTTGDHLLVYPRNSEAIVNAYVSMLNVDPHAIISENNNASYPHPTGISIAETLSHCVDLGALPSPGFARMILGTQQLDYVHEIANPRRTVIDLCLQADTRLSLEDFLYNAVPMKSRYYSIASSSIKRPDEVHLVFRPVHYMTSKGYLREGVCTSHLCHKGTMQKGAHDIACLSALINPNPGFRLPVNPKTPVMFIGGGCGVAPIRAFIEERVALAMQHDVGPATLFMGFRSPQDEVYQGLIQEALDTGALTESETAYSTGCEISIQHQMLVSDLVRKKSEHVWNHIQHGGYLYLCGGARTFGVAIEDALVDAFQEHGKMDSEGALKYLQNLVDEGRLAEDLNN